MKNSKQMNIIKFIRILTITTLLTLPVLTHGQTPTDPPPPPDDPGAPIDGGLSLLLAAGAVYGVKKYRNSRKKTNEPEMK
jgi:hypothetical protein